MWQDEVTSIPSELKLEIIQWLQNFVYMQPSTCHLKTRNGCSISSDSLVTWFGESSASCLHGTIDWDTIESREVTDHPLVKSQPLCMRNNIKHDSTDDNALSWFWEAFIQDDSNLKIVAVVGGECSDLMNDVVTDANGTARPGNIEDFHLKEFNFAEMLFSFWCYAFLYLSSNALVNESAKFWVLGVVCCTL